MCVHSINALLSAACGCVLQSSKLGFKDELTHHVQRLDLGRHLANYCRRLFSIDELIRKLQV
jgi:hypothetical protein